MSKIRSGQVPELSMVRSSSTKEPRQTFPKLPLLAMALATAPVPAEPVADTSTKGAVGSLLMMRMVALSLAPGVDGVKLTVNVTSSPGATVIGVAGVGSPAKSVEPNSTCTSETRRSVTPTLYTVIVRYCGPAQTVPNARLSCNPTAIAGPAGGPN